ncbi:MAG: phosphatidylserine/phosphatidylglycerophosphate/cardiolipin synthase family protein [candidate division SR1 bacterium]|nr:phosphatidylserine/phosphatidylglycerophosphate/cardiolipin synthase family protein [candidate division SR1 bacterium]
MKYKIYSKTKKFLDSLQEDIYNAKTSIYIEMYIFGDDDKKPYNFVDALIEKAQQGVHVVLVLDAFGSKELKETTIQKMQKAKIEIHFFSNRLRRTHRKLVMIDEKIAFFGGANIKKSTKHRLDLQIRIKGKISIKPFLKTFAYTYKMSGGTNRKITAYARKGFFKKIKSFLMENLPGHKMYRLTDYYREKMIHAKKSIKITTPYFMPPRWMIALLDNAQRRGVNVEIMIPYDTDIKMLNKINYYYISLLTDMGITFYAIKQMNHAKMMIIDDNEGVVGSQNIDHLSFSHNFEIGAFFKQKELVNILIDVFNGRKKKSVSYTTLDIRLTLRDRFVRAIYRAIFYII